MKGMDTMKQTKRKLTTFHQCHCMIVPPHVLEHMASADDEVARDAARFTLLQDNQFRTTRAAQVVDIATLARATTGIEASSSETATKKGAAKSSTEGTIAGIMAPPAGTAGRAVYDANHQWGQPPVFALKRGENDPVTPDQIVTNAYDGAGGVRDYYRNKLGRNSIDNLGLNQIHNVHLGVNYMNAFWDGATMNYGDGDGNIFVNFTDDPDVIGHELTHGVTQYTAALNYYSQSGALNESFSDVFGSAIEQAINGKNAGNADWLIGDGIMGPTLFGEALRSMKAPGTAYDNSLMGTDPQPDHMNNYYTGPRDNQGVHINSGIPNKVFYLVAMDIGTEKAALIWYTTLQNLWSTAVFSDFANVLVRSAQLLTQSVQVPVGTTQTVRAALKAVGL
jgi:Zn-dependent metalloprotease